eukprot:scaffold14107_cov52-Phaeocystis_antarctica.AAC.3
MVGPRMRTECNFGSFGSTPEGEGEHARCPGTHTARVHDEQRAIEAHARRPQQHLTLHAAAAAISISIAISTAAAALGTSTAARAAAVAVGRPSAARLRQRGGLVRGRGQDVLEAKYILSK